MHLLEIKFHATSMRVFFPNKEDAERELATLLPLLGKDPWDNKDKAKTHTIKSHVGDVVVVLEKVEAAQIVDIEADEEMMADTNDRIHQRAVERTIRAKQAMREAGVSDTM